MIASLARNTAWTEHFILWELPLCRALQYQHAEWCRQDVPCYLPHAAGNADARARFESWQQESTQPIEEAGGISLF